MGTDTGGDSKASIVQWREGKGGELYQCLLPIHQYENEGEQREGEDIVGANICAERSGRSMEGEHLGGKKAGAVDGGNGGGALHQNERGVWGVR